MATHCTSEVQNLADADVMNSQDSATFRRARESLFDVCQEAGNAYFGLFCLYPPSEGNLLNMCTPTASYDPEFLFTQMINGDLQDVGQLASIMSYPRLFAVEDWVFLFDYTIPSSGLVELDETIGGFAEWFIGTTFANATTDFPLNPTPGQELLRSRHSLLRATATDLPNILAISSADVPRLIAGDPNSATLHVTLLYDNGNIRIFENAAAVLAQEAPIWESFTDDRQGASNSGSQLEFVPVANGTLASVSSPNGRYILTVRAERVDLVFNSYNAPRFTAYTDVSDQLHAATDAQSVFCFQALNNPRNPLRFVDGRCSCLPSDRLAGRVYGRGSFDSLPGPTRARLISNLPCVLRDCEFDPAEYSNTSHLVGDRCIASIGFSDANLPSQINNITHAQDALSGETNCRTSVECPLGTNCFEGACLTTCATDAVCAAANPLATCINGNCILPPISQKIAQANQNLIIMIVLAVALFIVLLLILYYGIIRLKKYKRKSHV